MDVGAFQNEQSTGDGQDRWSIPSREKPDSYIEVDREQRILRGMQLRCTDWLVGMVVATRNSEVSQAGYQQKRTKIHTMLAKVSFYVMLAQLLFVVMCASLGFVR